MSLLARRYATALFDVAESRGETERVLADLERLHQVFGSPEGRAFLSDPNRSRDKLADAVRRAVEDSSPVTGNAVGVILARRREQILPDLFAEVRALARRKAGEAVAIVETGQPLSADEQEELRAQLERLTGQHIVLQVRDVPDILGGVRVRVGNTLYDGSLLGELEALRQRLLQAPVTRI